MSGREQALRDEIDELKERLRQMQDVLYGKGPFTTRLGLSRSEGELLCLLMLRDMATKQQLYDTLYLSDCDFGDKDIKIVDVYLHKIRAKVRCYGVEITTVWGAGYQLNKAAKARLKELEAMPKLPDPIDPGPLPSAKPRRPKPPPPPQPVVLPVLRRRIS